MTRFALTQIPHQAVQSLQIPTLHTQIVLIFEEKLMRFVCLHFVYNLLNNVPDATYRSHIVYLRRLFERRTLINNFCINNDRLNKHHS